MGTKIQGGKVGFAVAATLVMLLSASAAMSVPVRAWVVLGPTGQIVRGGKGITVTLGNVTSSQANYCLTTTRRMESGMVMNTETATFRSSAFVGITDSFAALAGCPPGTTTAVTVSGGNVNTSAASLLLTTIWMF